ncbi:uncharacterized protein LOC132274328 [Cornus florida]|uniref:uncharacterized protein LOC132274328 n=1 Tax=Cornus florida TaxID=4283 RepID=UPI00289CE2A6|nr:uncharacterized protein LOC132274328 [Cornus florida]XP_059631561.1 uncharacterized protein LOC132274328 [Cornus florida]XP_059631562.1 uncharacterized protein LOC132274328 [Cornus florida]
MDFRSMKRKELQALCKKHNIPANLTNMDMANKLSSLLKEKEKPITRGRSCLKDIGEIASVNDSDENRKLKKVRFSPENEMIEFVDLDPEPREARLVARRRSMGRPVMEKNKDIVFENVDSNDNIVDNATRNRGSRAQKTVGEVIRPVPMLPIEKKRARRGVSADVLEAKDVDSNVMDLSDNLASETAAVEETGVPMRRSLRNREVVVENEKEGEIVGLRVLRKNVTQGKKNAKGSKKISENKGLAVDSEITQPEKPLTRSKQNVMKVEGSELLNRELGQNEMVRRKRITRSRTEWAMEETEVDEVQGESEIVLQLEEPSMQPGRNGNRRKSVMHIKEKVLPEGPVAENENRKLKRSSCSEGGSTVQIPTVNEKDSLPGGPLRRSRRNTSSEPVVEYVRRSRQIGSRHESVAVSDALDGITNVFVKKTEVKVRGESEMVVLQHEEPLMHPGRNRQKSVMHRNEKLVPEGHVAENENRKISRNLSSEGGSTVEIQKENEKDSLPGDPSRRSRRNTSSQPNGSSHELVPVSGALDGTTNAIVENKTRKRRRDPILEEEIVVTEFAPLIEDSPRRSKRNAVKSNLVMPGVVAGKVVGKRKAKGRSKTPIVEVEASPLNGSALATEELPLVDAQLAMSVVVESATDPVSSSRKQTSKDTTEKKSSTKKVVCPVTSELEKARDVITVNSFGTQASESAKMHSDYSHKEEESFVSKAVVVTEEFAPLVEESPRRSKRNAVKSNLVVAVVVSGKGVGKKKAKGRSKAPIVEVEASPLIESTLATEEPPLVDAQLAMGDVVETVTDPVSSSCKQTSKDTTEKKYSTKKVVVPGVVPGKFVGKKKAKGRSKAPIVEVEASPLIERTLATEEPPLVDAKLAMGDVGESATDPVSSSCKQTSTKSSTKKVVSPETSDLENARDITIVNSPGTPVSESAKMHSDYSHKEGESFVSKAVVVTEEVNISFGVDEGDLVSESLERSGNFHCNDIVEPQPEEVLNLVSGVASPQTIHAGGPVSVLDLGTELETNEKPSKVRHSRPSFTVPKYGFEVEKATPHEEQNLKLEAGDSFGGPVRHEMVLGGRLTESDETGGSKKSSEIASKEAGDVTVIDSSDGTGITPVNGVEKSADTAEEMTVTSPALNAGLSDEEVPESASGLVFSSSNKVFNDTNKRKGSTRHGSNEVCTRSPHLEGVRDPSVVKPEGTAASNSLKLQSDPAEQEMNDSVSEFFVVAEKENVAVVVGDDNLLQSDTGKGSEYDLVSPPHNISEDFNCTTLVDLESASEKATEIKSLDLSDGGRVTPIMVGGNVEDGLQETMSVSHVMPAENAAENVTEVQLTSVYFFPGKPSCNFIVGPEDQACCIGDEVTHSTGDVLSIDNDARKQDVTQAKVLSNVQIEEFPTDMENKSEESSYLKKAMQYVDKERNYEDLEGNLFMEEIYSQEAIDESSIEMENKLKEASHVKKALQAIDGETSCEKLEGNPSMYDNPISISNELDGQLAKENENEGLVRNCIHVSEEIREGSTRGFTDGERTSLIISEERDTDKIEDTLTPIVIPKYSGNDGSMSSYDRTPLKDDRSEEGDGLKRLFATPAGIFDVMVPRGLPLEVVGTVESEHEKAASTSNALSISDEEFIDEGSNEKADVFDCTPLKDDGREEGDGLKTLFATPAIDRNSNEEASSHESGTVDVMMHKGLPREVVGTMESEHEKTAASKSNALPSSDEEFIDEGFNEKSDVYDRTPLKDDGREEGDGLETLFATPAHDRNSNEEASSHETGTVDVTMPKGLPREVVGTMESEQEKSAASKSNAQPISNEEFIDEGFYEKADANHTPLKVDRREEGDGLKTLFAAPANDRNSNEEASSHETGTVDVMMHKGLPQEVVGTMETEHEKSAASKSNALPISDEEFIDEGFNEKTDVYDRTPLKDDRREEGDGLKTLFATPAHDRNSNEEASTHETGTVDVMLAKGLPREIVGTMESEHEKSTASKSNALSISVEEFIDEGSNEKADVEFIPNYVSEYKVSGTSNKEMLCIKHNLSTDNDMPHQDVPSIKYATGTKAKVDAKSTEGDSDVQCDDLVNEEENAEFPPEVASPEPCDCEDGLAQVIGSSGASLAETMFTESEASDEKLTADLSKSSSKCFEGTTMKKEKENEETMSSFGRLGLVKVATDHGDKFAKWNINSLGALYEVSEKIAKEELILADAEADMDRNDSEGVSMGVKNRNMPEPDGVECGELDIFNDEGISALDKSTLASVKQTDRKGDVRLAEFSDVFEETMPQVDEMKLGDCSGHKMEIVQELDKSEDGEDSQELLADDVTGTMLQVDEVKHGDLGSQKDVATKEGSLDVKDRSSDAVKKTDVPIGYFDLNLEHEKVSTNVSNSDGEKNDSHLFEGDMSIAEGKKINEVVSEDQLNDAHGFAVSPIASIFVDEDKGNMHNTPTVMDGEDSRELSADDCMRVNNVSDDSKDGSHIEDNVKSFLEVSKEHPVNNEDALVDDASLGGFGCLTPNKLLCGDESKSIAEETKEASGSLHNNVDMVPCAGDSNESAEQNFFVNSVSAPAGNSNTAAIPSFKCSVNHGTTEQGASGFNVESCTFSSWEMNLFSGDDDVFEKLYGDTSETNYICEGSENAREVKENATIMLAEEQPGNSEYHMEEKFEESSDSFLASFKELNDVVVTTKEYNYSEYIEKEESSVAMHDMILTDIANMNGCERAASVEPRAEGDSNYSVVENPAHTECGERGEEIEPIEDVLKSNSRMVDQLHSFTDSAVDGGFPAVSARGKISVAEMEKDNSLSAKQINSTAKKWKDARASLIQGTPKKLITTLDMKENAAPSIKREQTSNATMVKSVTKRRALEDLRRK